jgi:hypothetical protein
VVVSDETVPKRTLEGLAHAVSEIGDRLYVLNRDHVL